MFGWRHRAIRLVVSFHRLCFYLHCLIYASLPCTNCAQRRWCRCLMPSNARHESTETFHTKHDTHTHEIDFNLTNLWIIYFIFSIFLTPSKITSPPSPSPPPHYTATHNSTHKLKIRNGIIFKVMAFIDEVSSVADEVVSFYRIGFRYR